MSRNLNAGRSHSIKIEDNSFEMVGDFKYLGTTLLSNFLPSFLTYLLTPWSSVLLENLTGFQLVKKFPAFYGARIHKCPPPIPILSLLDPIHTPTSHSLEIRLNIILPFTPGSPKWSLSLRFPHQTPVCASLLPHTRYMPRASNSSRFCHLNNIG